MRTWWIACAWALAGIACAPAPRAVLAPLPVPRDGALPVPAGYRQWPRFLSGVQRPDLDEVREIYISPAAHAAATPQGLPDGAQLVMEIYAAQRGPDGRPLIAADGRLLHGVLERVLVMGKNPGWGQGVIEPLRNGSWVYATYLADGRTRAPEEPMTCRACHRQHAARDFVPRYDEYLAARR